GARPRAAPGRTAAKASPACTRPRSGCMRPGPEPRATSTRGELARFSRGTWPIQPRSGGAVTRTEGVFASGPHETSPPFLDLTLAGSLCPPRRLSCRGMGACSTPRLVIDAARCAVASCLALLALAPMSRADTVKVVIPGEGVEVSLDIPGYRPEKPDPRAE